MPVTGAAVGQVDPTQAQVGQSGGPSDLKMAIIDYTLSAGGDYATGIAVNGASSMLTAIPASVGMTTIIGVIILTVTRAGATQFGLSCFDPVTSRVNWVTTAASITQSPIAGTQFSGAAAGDIFRVLAIGI